MLSRFYKNVKREMGGGSKHKITESYNLGVGECFGGGMVSNEVLIP